MTCHTQREPTHAFGVPWAELTRGRLLKELHPSAMLARGCFVLCKHQCVWTGIESLMFLIVARPKVMRLCSQATYRIFRQHGASRKNPGGGGLKHGQPPPLATPLVRAGRDVVMKLADVVAASGGMPIVRSLTADIWSAARFCVMGAWVYIRRHCHALRCNNSKFAHTGEVCVRTPTSFGVNHGPLTTPSAGMHNGR